MMTSTAKPRKSKPLLMPEQAIGRLARTFRGIARKLWPSNDYFVQEDLIQEMNLACLAVRTPMTAKTFVSLALCRAIDYLDREARHRRLIQMDHAKLVRLSDACQRITARPEPESRARS